MKKTSRARNTIRRRCSAAVSDAARLKGRGGREVAGRAAPGDSVCILPAAEASFVRRVSAIVLLRITVTLLLFARCIAESWTCTLMFVSEPETS
ncbi:hypothetical protein EYF80_023661 [Liparis tanakae]|uniref:Uncharacterized protein n=1 Tax=Liparis tanakae TaxID=230148 RepID=A0A4Z2HMH5_9TELE|nr:hypothetical protein EYF80_023661 [Liparis tanakae]